MDVMQRLKPYLGSEVDNGRYRSQEGQRAVTWWVVITVIFYCCYALSAQVHESKQI